MKSEAVFCELLTFSFYVRLHFEIVAFSESHVSGFRVHHSFKTSVSKP